MARKMRGVETKICPKCGQEVYADMTVCFGCLHEFGESPQAGMSIFEYGRDEAYLDLIDSLGRYIAMTVSEARIVDDIALLRRAAKQEEADGERSHAFMSGFIADTLETAMKEYKEEQIEQHKARKRGGTRTNSTTAGNLQLV